MKTDNGWISASDAMPRESVRVMVWFKEECHSARLKSGSGLWEIDNDTVLGDKKTISWWRPFPEGPRSGAHTTIGV